ncbi:hypothetical protein F751_4215 [Auxenochlorella protothecoides]|uniref:Uncharacterized protein n=1 Tax=Auxenochlorella protothecoides TaxID=3075 RepID=A0A087SA17_AUXPR|nr:hypothetical protein F751_4215 [Auxenochlorella protothecoides]KFM22571.1 hypothetical protein F751_4215 [Auxenochlorella protothecoides]
MECLQEKTLRARHERNRATIPRPLTWAGPGAVSQPRCGQAMPMKWTGSSLPAMRPVSASYRRPMA